MENVSGVIASGSLGWTEACACNKASLYFICSWCYGGKHFSSKIKQSHPCDCCYEEYKLLAGFSKAFSVSLPMTLEIKKCFHLCPPLTSVKLLKNPLLFSADCHYSMDLKVNLSLIVSPAWDHSNHVVDQQFPHLFHIQNDSVFSLVSP